MEKKSFKPVISKNQQIFLVCVVAVFIFWLLRELSSSPNILSLTNKGTAELETTNNQTYLPTSTPPQAQEYIIEGKVVENADKTKTYSDKKAGFSFTYTDSDEFGRLYEGKEGEYARFKGYSIQVHKNYLGGSKKQWYLDNFGDPKVQGYEVHYEDYKVDGYNALIVGTYDPGSMGGRSIFIFKGNSVYDLSFGYAGNENNDSIKKLVSGLKFL